MALSVHQLAPLATYDGEPIRAGVDRVRCWADYGWLEIIGPKHPGTGRSRMYTDATALRVAAIALFQRAGIPPVPAWRMLSMCPDLATVGRVTLNLTDAVSVAIDGAAVRRHAALIGEQEAA